MTFVDTSAIYALADRVDPNHQRAVKCFVGLLESGARLVTHNYVIIESMALLQRRLGLQSARRFAADIGSFEVEWVTAPVHEAAVAALSESGSRGVSLVDHVSFVVMKARGLRQAFAFDADFVTRGFEVVGPV